MTLWIWLASSYLITAWAIMFGGAYLWSKQFDTDDLLFLGICWPITLPFAIIPLLLFLLADRMTEKKKP